MALGRENISVARTDGSEDIFCLTGFLSDDDLIRHASKAHSYEVDSVA
jgi:hypothetical protein